ncbi:hypothetical protein [Hymenobacter ruricola]|uniref:Uncharacterized protein n=1 Tax=Hymenobacter ruricola TaxID=2791023 RepID=A0ABS0I944_9BACT|nr:hypothetical protein [Hymenobacter ruricola]MBF9223455.1 hypothetical protein [Hymenobacter ruricola]
MNKDQLARLARHRKVQQVLADNATAVAAVPAFARLAAQYQAQLGLLDGTARKKGVASEGATLAKSAVGTALIARLVKAANALYLLYKAEEPANVAEAAGLHRRASDYTAMTDQALAAEATDLARRAAAHASVLKKEYNWDTDATTALADAAQAFAAQLSAPQLAIDAAKIKGATAKSTLSALNVFLKDDLRAGMELLKDTHEDAYKALREASQVDDAAYQKKKAKRLVGRETGQDNTTA